MVEARPSIRWIIIGTGVISAIHFLLHPALGLSLGGFLSETVGLPRTSAIYAYLALIAAISYFVGGFLIGWMSPGTTIREASIAGVLAAFLNNVRDRLYWPDEYNFLAAMVGLLLGLVTALAGAKLGERFQGDSTHKMRERGELPPID